MVTTGIDVLWLMFWVPRYNEKEMAKWTDTWNHSNVEAPKAL